MNTRNWQVESSNPHTIQVDHWYVFSGRVHIYVDNEGIYERRKKLWDTGLEHRFKLDGENYLVRILYRTWHYEYELWIDGKLQ